MGKFRDNMHCEKFCTSLVKLSKKVHHFPLLLESFYLPLVKVFLEVWTKKVTYCKYFSVLKVSKSSLSHSTTLLYNPEIIYLTLEKKVKQ